MTLRQILLKAGYHCIFNGLYKHYYYQESDDDLMELSLTYRRVRDELLGVPLNDGTQGHILIRPQGDAETKEVEEVVLQDKDGIFGVDLVPWEDLIDREVVGVPPYKGTIAEMAAHILWEITFYGYSSADIRERLELLTDEMKEAAKNYNNLID